MTLAKAGLLCMVYCCSLSQGPFSPLPFVIWTCVFFQDTVASIRLFSISQLSLWYHGKPWCKGQKGEAESSGEDLLGVRSLQAEIPFESQMTIKGNKISWPCKWYTLHMFTLSFAWLILHMLQKWLPVGAQVSAMDLIIYISLPSIICDHRSQ